MADLKEEILKIGNVLAIAAAMLGNESLSKKIKLFLSEGATFTDEENEEISKLLSGYNITVSELNDEFFPLTHEEDLTSADGRFFFSDFTFRPVEVRAVYRDGVEVPYTHHPTYISAGYNNITVLYEYLIDEASDLSAACPYLGTVITDRIIAQGIVSEYAIICGMYEHAIMWRDRYLSSLKSALLRRKVKNIRQRAWY